jgi:hypothetical protein
MKKNIKLLLALMMSIGFGVSYSQTTVMSAVAPTPVSPIIVSPNATAALASATTNRIFLDQSGDNPTINLNQTGNSNRQGSAISPIYLRGIGQTVTTIQTGNSNELDLAVSNATTGSVGATVMIQQIGNSNKIDAACGSGTASDGTTALTGCKSANLNWKFAGNTNTLQYRATGDNQSSAITVAGNTNAFYVDSLTANNSQTVQVTGDTNTFNFKQTSTGAAGSSIWVQLTGSSNTMNITQGGTVDNVANIKSVANAGSINVTQKN